jgi:signal transduction histidine kinase
LIYTGIASLRKTTTSAILYLAATGSVILSGMYHILAQSYGLLSPEFNPLFIGILVEISFLSSALILQYGEVQRERAKLKNELVQQENKMFQQYIEGIEKERNRIAGDLHDNIGSKLSNIKRTYFTNEAEEATERMTSLIEEVRTLSHDLAPTIAKVSGLMPLVEKLIVEARSRLISNYKRSGSGKYYQWKVLFRFTVLFRSRSTTSRFTPKQNGQTSNFLVTTRNWL